MRRDAGRAAGSVDIARASAVSAITVLLEPPLEPESSPGPLSLEPEPPPEVEPLGTQLREIESPLEPELALLEPEPPLDGKPPLEPEVAPELEPPPELEGNPSPGPAVFDVVPEPQA